MNGKAITAEDLFSEVLALERAIASLKNKFLSIMPPKYGSDVWWERSIEEGIASIKANKGKKFDNYEDAVKYLNS